MPTALPDSSASDPQPSSDSTSPAELTRLGDIVPRLRPDLSMDPRQGEPGLFQVAINDGSGRSFTLYDFEVSISRMLDGRRAASQLIEAAGKIGIPVTLESLRKFIRQLRAYGFIEEIPVVAVGEAGWAPRAEWRPEVRELFQSALRTFRNDRPTEARGYVEALLQIEPDVPEAQALLARIEERILSGEASPLPAFNQLHGDGSDDAGFEQRFPPPPPRVSEDAFEDSVVAQRPRRRWPWVALGAGLLGAAGVMAVPVRAHVSASAELSSVGAPSELLAPRAGKIAEELAKPGEWVKAGQKLVRLDDTGLVQREEALQTELAELTHQIESLQKRAERRTVLKAKAAWEKKEAQVGKLKAQREALAQREDVRSRRRLRSLDRTLAKKTRDATRLQATYERHAGSAQLQTLTAQKKAKEAERASLEEARAHSVLVAAQDGAFQPHRRVGDPVLSGEAVGTLVDARKLKVTLGVPASQAMRVKEGQAVSLRVNGSAAELHTAILTTSGESAGAGLVRATALLENADHKLKVGAGGLAEIDVGSRPLYQRFLPSR